LLLCTESDNHAHQQPTQFAEENGDTPISVWASTYVVKIVT